MAGAESVTRSIQWFEDQVDADEFYRNNWRLNLTRQVDNSLGQYGFNVIWKSIGISPMVNIWWEEDYALNWSATLPSAGTP